MKKILDTTEKLFSRDEVDEVVAELNAGDPDWNYIAEHCPNGAGYSKIKIYDENNEFVGYF